MRVHPFFLVLSCLLAFAVAGCNTGKGVNSGSTHGTMLNMIPARNANPSAVKSDQLVPSA